VVDTSEDFVWRRSGVNLTLSKPDISCPVCSIGMLVECDKGNYLCSVCKRWFVGDK
jgi:hypothetical protein